MRRILAINKVVYCILIICLCIWINSCNQEKKIRFVSSDLFVTMKIMDDSIKLYVEKSNDYRNGIYISDRKSKRLVNEMGDTLPFHFSEVNPIVNYRDSTIELFSESCESKWDSLVILSNYLLDSSITLSKIVLHNSGKINIEGRFSKYLSESKNRLACVMKGRSFELLDEEVSKISINCFKMWRDNDSDKVSYLKLKKCFNGHCEIYHGDFIPLSYIHLNMVLLAPEKMIICPF